MSYEWAPSKAAINYHKHKIDFADAVAVLEDELAITLGDDYPEEDRYVTIGMDAFGRVLVLVYTYREENIRIISARKAMPRECRQYELGL